MDVEMSGSRFIIKLSDKATAELSFRRDGGFLYLDSTYTPEEFRGRGVGSRLVQAAIRYAEEERLKIVPNCEFAIEYFKRHPEYSSLLHKD